LAFGVSKNMFGYIQANMDFEKKNRQVDLSNFHVWPSVRKDLDSRKLFLLFFRIDFYCDHFEPIRDE